MAADIDRVRFHSAKVSPLHSLRRVPIAIALSRDSFRPSTLGLRGGHADHERWFCGLISQDSSPLGTHTRQTTIATRGNLSCLCIRDLYVGVSVLSRPRSPPPRPRLGGAIPPISLGAVQSERIVADKEDSYLCPGFASTALRSPSMAMVLAPTKTSRIHLASAALRRMNGSSRPVLFD